jgi:hypothetical protein
MTTSTENTRRSLKNNRSLTLDGANKMFEAIGLKIERHDLGYYECRYRGTDYQSETLTAMCKELIRLHMPQNE